MIIGGIHERVSTDASWGSRWVQPPMAARGPSVAPPVPADAMPAISATLDPSGNRGEAWSDKTQPVGGFILIGNPATILWTAVVTNPTVQEWVRDVIGWSEPTTPTGDPVAW